VTRPTRWRFEAANAPVHLREASDELEAVLASEGVGGRACFAARLVCEEIVLNAFEHGGASFVTMEVTPVDDPHRLAFEWDGIPFDPALPLATHRSDTPGDIHPRGRGLILVRRFTTSLEHRLAGGRNRLSVRLAE